MGALGFDRHTLTQREVNELVADLDWRPLSAESPEVGDVIKYRDGSFAFVGTSPHVSYGPREQMESVARIYPRGGEVKDGAGADGGEGDDGERS
jgi:hypothetical protein